MREPEWYVIQVQAGRELKACETVRRACAAAAVRTGAEGTLVDCFSPSYEFRRKVQGEWVVHRKLLLPGYVIAVTKDPWGLARVLQATSEFTRVLAMGKTFVPLSADDRSWMERWMAEGDHAIPISFAYKECADSGVGILFDCVLLPSASSHSLPRQRGGLTLVTGSASGRAAYWRHHVRHGGVHPTATPRVATTLC